MIEKTIDKAASPDIYITAALDRRPTGPIDAGREKDALLGLAAAMAERPAEILPQLVALAMELTGATSAGLSLLEEQPGDGLFRWRWLHGLLAPYENATSPRNSSPSGVTLDQNRPVLASHPEIIYEWMSEQHLVIPEVLLTPLYIGSDEPLGTLWVVAPDEGHFHAGHARITAELADFASNALKMIRTEERLRAALDEQEMLAREMNHRLKNLFAMTDGMIRGSARSADTVEDLAEALSGRLHALSSAHALVQRNATELGEDDRRTELADLIAAVVAVHEIAPEGAPSRFSIGGPSVSCGDHAINTTALIIHELATNAAKYGALSNDTGRVKISWRIEDGTLALDWREEGGPPIEATPRHEGFGTTLVSRTIERYFNGIADYEWRDSGLHLHFTASLDKLAS